MDNSNGLGGKRTDWAKRSRRSAIYCAMRSRIIQARNKLRSYSIRPNEKIISHLMFRLVRFKE